MKKAAQINMNIINQQAPIQNSTQIRFTPKTSSSQSYRAGQQNFQLMEDLLYSKKSGSNPNLMKKMPSSTTNKFHQKNQSHGGQININDQQFSNISKTPKLASGITKGVGYGRGLHSPQGNGNTSNGFGSKKGKSSTNGIQQSQNLLQSQQIDQSYFKKYFPSNKNQQSHQNQQQQQSQKLKYNNYFEEDNINASNLKATLNNKLSINQSNGMHSRGVNKSQTISNNKITSSDRPPSNDKNWKQNYLKNLKEYQRNVKKTKNENGNLIHISSHHNQSSGNLQKNQNSNNNSNSSQLYETKNSNGYKQNNQELQENNKQGIQNQNSNLNSLVTKVNRGDNLLGNLPQFNSPRAGNGINKNIKLPQTTPKGGSSGKINNPMTNLLKSQNQNQIQNDENGGGQGVGAGTNSKKQEYVLNSAKNQSRKMFHFPTHNKSNSYTSMQFKNNQTVGVPNSAKNSTNQSYNNTANMHSSMYQSHATQYENGAKNVAYIQQPTPKKQQQKQQPQQYQMQLKQQQQQQQQQNQTLKTHSRGSNSQVSLTVKQQQIIQDKNKFLYYMTNLERAYRIPQSQDYFSQLQREHFLQTCQGIMYSNLARPANPRDLQDKKVHLKKRLPHQKKTIVFDLDETLIHCNENVNMPHDVKLQIKFPQGEIIEAGINIRPYARQILKDLSENYEIIVFTASHQCYARTVIDHLDPQNQWVSHRFFREHCIQTPQGVYIKDLRIFADRDLSDIVLVDNAAYSFSFQVDNGIPIIPYYHHKDDKELKYLQQFLSKLDNFKDVRDYMRQTFRLQQYNDQEGPGRVYEKLFGKKI